MRAGREPGREGRPRSRPGRASARRSARGRRARAARCGSSGGSRGRRRRAAPTARRPAVPAPGRPSAFTVASLTVPSTSSVKTRLEPRLHVRADPLPERPAGGQHLAGHRVLDALVGDVQSEQRQLRRDPGAVVPGADLLAPAADRIQCRIGDDARSAAESLAERGQERPSAAREVAGAELGAHDQVARAPPVRAGQPVERSVVDAVGAGPEVERDVGADQRAPADEGAAAEVAGVVVLGGVQPIAVFGGEQVVGREVRPAVDARARGRRRRSAGSPGTARRRRCGGPPRRSGRARRPRGW